MRPKRPPELFSEANMLYWRKYLWHFWDFSAPSAVIQRPVVIRRPGNYAPLVTSLEGWACHKKPDMATHRAPVAATDRYFGHKFEALQLQENFVCTTKKKSGLSVDLKTMLFKNSSDFALGFHQGCGVEGFWVESDFFIRLEVQWIHFIHCTLTLGILTRACWNGTTSFEIFIETILAVYHDFHWLLVAAKSFDSQTSFM